MRALPNMKLTQFTLGAGLVALLTGTASAQVQLNELFVSHGGTDNMEYIELMGPPGTMLDGYIVCVIEGEATNPNVGFLDRAWDLSGEVIPPGGYFVLGDTAVTPNDFDIGLENRLENGANTFELVLTTDIPTIMAMLDTDIDPDGDFVSAMANDPNTTVVDVVGMIDATFDTGCIDPLDEFYDGAVVYGPDEGLGGPCNPMGVYLPAGIFRDSDNDWVDGEWLEFAPTNWPGNLTPGAGNGPCVSCNPQIGANYCMVNPTSTGNPSIMSTSGSASIAANDLVIACDNIPGTEPGVFFYGAMQGQFPFGEGFRCVTGTIFRLWPPSTSSAGTLTRAIDYNNVPTAILSGSTWNFQGWFRDPTGGPAGFNLSDGLEIIFVP